MGSKYLYFLHIRCIIYPLPGTSPISVDIISFQKSIIISDETELTPIPSIKIGSFLRQSIISCGDKVIKEKDKKQNPSAPFITVVSVKVIGVLLTIDEKEPDEKLIDVPEDMVVNDLTDLGNHILIKIKHFFYF